MPGTTASSSASSNFKCGQIGSLTNALGGCGDPCTCEVVQGTRGSALAEARVPWTTSHVQGSPQPPKAFVSEPIWPHLKLEEALELAVVPGMKRFLVVQRRGKIFSFPTDDSGGAAELVLDLRAL